MTVSLRSILMGGVIAAISVMPLSGPVLAGGTTANPDNPGGDAPVVFTAAEIQLAVDLANLLGLTADATTLENAEPGSPAAIAAVLNIATTIAPLITALIPSATPAQLSTMLAIVNRIISATGGSPTLTALAAALSAAGA